YGRTGTPVAPAEFLHWSAALSLDLCDYWIAIGTQHDIEGCDRGAEEAFRRAQRSDPGRAEPQIHLGLLHASEGRAQEAIRELEQAARLAPRYADVRYLLGLLYEDVGRLDEAETEFRNALDEHPRYTMARLALGSLLAAQGRDREALQLLESVQRTGVSSADLESHLADLYDGLGQTVAAERARARAHALSSAGD
ncbi:MAG: tetratricopeptide repeat protein, partial [Candidatus Krumholzibacteriia bacterium]